MEKLQAFKIILKKPIIIHITERRNKPEKKASTLEVPTTYLETMAPGKYSFMNLLCFYLIIDPIRNFCIAILLSMFYTCWFQVSIHKGIISRILSTEDTKDPTESGDEYCNTYYPLQVCSLVAPYWNDKM